MNNNNPWLSAYQNSSVFGKSPGEIQNLQKVAQSIKSQPAKKGNIVTHNLDTAGGIGGGLAGAAAGAAIGSVVPGIGTAIGGVAGGLIGAFGGGAAGKAAQQGIEGSGFNAGDIAKAGLLNAGGEALGGGIVTVAVKVGSKVLPKALKGSMPITDSLDSIANKKISQQIASNLPANALKSNRDVARLNDQSNLARTLGLYNGTARQKAASIATGPTGFVNGIKQDVLSQSGHVPILNNLNDTVTNAIAEHGVAGNADKKAIQDAVKAQVNKTIGPQGSVGDMTVDASKAFKMQQSLEKLGMQQAKANKPEIANAYRDIASSIGKQIDQHAGTNAAVAAFNVPTEMAAQLTTRAVNSLGKKKGTALANHLVESVNAAKSVPDLRAVEAKLIPGAQAATNADIKSLQSGAGKTAEGLAGAAVSPYGRLGLARSAMGKLAAPEAAVAGKIANVTAPIERNLPNVLKRATGQGAVRSIDSSVNPQTPTPVADPNAEKYASDLQTLADPALPAKMATSSQSLMDSTGGQSDGMDMNSMYSKANMVSDIQRDPKNISSYLTLYKELNPAASTTQTAGYSKPSASQYSQAVSGAQSISQLENMLKSDPNVVAKNTAPGQTIPGIGGLISNAAGTNDYRAITQNILNSVARINTGANMPKSEEAFYTRTYLPQPGDTAKTIQDKMANLRSFFTPVLNYQSGSDGSSINSDNSQ